MMNKAKNGEKHYIANKIVKNKEILKKIESYDIQNAKKKEAQNKDKDHIEKFERERVPICRCEINFIEMEEENNLDFEKNHM